MGYKHSIFVSALVFLLICSGAGGQRRASADDVVQFVLGFLKQYFPVQPPKPTAILQKTPEETEPDEALQRHLVKHCGVCHAGPRRVVKRFDMSQIADLKRNLPLNVAAPMESLIWRKVKAGKMPPSTATPLTNAERSELATLLGRLAKPLQGADHSPSEAQANTAPIVPPSSVLPTIQDYVETNPDLSKFVLWAKTSGVWDEVPKIGSYTIFFPTNQAVDELGPENRVFLLEGTGEDPLGNLRDVILNHGAAPMYRAVELNKEGSVWTMKTEVTIREDSEGLWVADAKIIKRDVECSNGIIHIIDKVLVPPSVRELLPKVRTYVGPGIEMVVIPRGQFQMGAPLNEAGRYPTDGPQHPVQLLTPFEISVCETTRSQFVAVMGDSVIDSSNTNMPGRREQPKPNEDPVQSLTWFHAVEFCNKLSELERVPKYYVLNDLRKEGDVKVFDVVIADPNSHGFRLPTEAEWEYACRAHSGEAFCFGNNKAMLDDYAWHAGNSFQNKTHPVKTKKANAYGLFDMHGNVSEWCQDWYEPNYDVAGNLVTDPRGPAAGKLRVIRGGSYMWNWQDCRSAARFPARSHAPSFCHRSIGFRVARYLPPENAGKRGFADAK
ncbi:MAG: SUMF1/EgtB/PvdO family nonheme iron enzyme [Pirellulaceae bacterium]